MERQVSDQKRAMIPLEGVSEERAANLRSGFEEVGLMTADAEGAGGFVAWRDIEQESGLIRWQGIEAMHVISMSGVGKAWNVGERHSV